MPVRGYETTSGLQFVILSLSRKLLETFHNTSDRRDDRTTTVDRIWSCGRVLLCGHYEYPGSERQMVD